MLPYWYSRDILYTGGQSPTFCFLYFLFPFLMCLLVDFAGGISSDTHHLMSFISCLLPPLDRLHSHLHQPVLGFAIGEIADALDGLLGVVLGQRACLVDTVCFEDELSCLFCKCQ